VARLERRQAATLFHIGANPIVPSWIAIQVNASEAQMEDWILENKEALFRFCLTRIQHLAQESQASADNPRHWAACQDLFLLWQRAHEKAYVSIHHPDYAHHQEAQAAVKKAQKREEKHLESLNRLERWNWKRRRFRYDAYLWLRYQPSLWQERVSDSLGGF